MFPVAPPALCRDVTQDPPIQKQVVWHKWDMTKEVAETFSFQG